MPDEKCMLERDLIFGAIVSEREAQDQQWGGPTHDDSHEPWQWCSYIRRQAALAERLEEAGFENRMVKIAALAIAAIESSKRQRS